MTHTQTQGADGAGTKTAGEPLDLRDLHAANIARQAEWCPDQVPDLSFRGNELGGECGEAQNVIKKLERERQGWRGSRATKDDLADELADVVICADLCAVTAGIDLGAAVRRKFNATSEKQGLSVFLPMPSTPAPAATPGVPDSVRAQVAAAIGRVMCECGPGLATGMGCFEKAADAVLALIAAQPAGQAGVQDSVRALSELEEKFNASRKHALENADRAKPRDDLYDYYCGQLGQASAYFHAVRAVQALIAAQPAGQAGDAGADGWLPIETAPKDGTRVDLWVVPHDAFANGNADRLEARWMERVGWVRIGGGYVSECGKPTHWRPRPGAPGKPAPDSACTGQAEQLRRIGHAVRDVVRSAWSLCDLTEDGGEPGQDIPPTAWKQLADAVTALEALIPADEQPDSAGHAVTLLIEALAARQPAPNSTRTRAAETGDKLVSLLASVSDRLRDNPPNGLVEGDLYVAAKNEGPDSGWRYVPTGLTVGDLDEARALIAARPEAPSDAGWRDISTAPKDGTEFWAWLEDSGVRKVRWWTAEEICEEEDRGTPDDYLAGFYEVADRTEWWIFRWWMPAECLPTPPSDPAPSGQAGTFPKPRWKDGEPPCGECHLHAGETCDICGAVAPPAPSGQAED